tara:strand:- start:475 stop:1227 length:753 start_codon:yes stop_codon:yes gene_type:complete
VKFEEKIKQKYLYSNKQNLFKKIYFFFQKIKSYKFIKKSFSGSAQDLIINHFFKDQKEGFYIDVGCYHPFINNNTKLFHKKGWSGINIDLDYHTIDFFNHVRKTDENIHIAISDEETEKELYFFHNRSAINSLDPKRKNEAKETKKVQTKKLDSIIENSKFKERKINFLSIDVEGHEYEVIKSFNLQKYSPEIILIEFIDSNAKSTNFIDQNLNTIIESKIYKHMIKYNYHFVNWLHNDLIFAHNSVRNK